MDNTHPGFFVLKGIVNLTNMQYVRQSIIITANKGISPITIDLSKVKQIDKESIVVFLNLYTRLRRKGVILSIEGPQKSILNLFRQYGLDTDV